MFKIEDLILRVPNMITLQQCKLLIDYHIKNEEKYELESSPEATTGVDTTSSFKCLTLPPGSEIHNIIHLKTREMVQRWLKYLKKFKAFHVPLLSAELNYSHKYRLLKYEPGAKIHAHTDFANFTHASCTFNLNDNYSGGIFKFWNGQYTVKLKKGEGMIWPADYFWVHEVSPIKKGVRYSTNCFIKSIDEELCLKTIEQTHNTARDRAKDTQANHQSQYFWKKI
jgi:hypothetical protein